MKLHERVLVGSMLAAACLSMSGCIVRAERVVYDPPVPHVPRTTTTTTTVIRSDEPNYNPVPTYGRKHQFYYYPTAQVYKDCESNRWHWFHNNKWNVSIDLPKTIVLDVDGPVAVEIDADEPSGHHAIVSREHPGRGHAFGHHKDKHDHDDRYGRGDDRDDHDSRDWDNDRGDKNDKKDKKDRKDKKDKKDKKRYGNANDRDRHDD